MLRPYVIIALILSVWPSAPCRTCWADGAILDRGHASADFVEQAWNRLATVDAVRGSIAMPALARGESSDLLSEAVRLEGIDDGAVRQYRARLDRHAAEATRRVAMVNSVEDRAQALFTYLHSAVLTGRFQADCHRLTQTLDTGDYNCLTGTLLFVGLARRCGLEAAAVLAPSHVFARVAVGNACVDVETTCPRWFTASESQRRRWLDAALGEANRAATANRVARNEPRTLSDASLLGVAYYNRGVTQFAQRQFPAAVAANLIALRLDPENSAARENLLAAVNNWALECSVAGRPEESLDLLARGRELAPERADLRASHRYVVDRLTTTPKIAAPRSDDSASR